MWTNEIYDTAADRAITSLRAENHHEYGLIRFCCSPLWCTSMSMKVRTFAER
jgi:hypothetical protein